MRRHFCIFVFLLSVTVLKVHASQLPEFPFVFSEGEATEDVKPDIAVIAFSVKEFNEVSAAALEVVEEQSVNLIALFDEMKVGREDIIAYEIDKRAVRERKDYQQLNILGYELSRPFSVTLRDVSHYEQFVKKLLSLKNVVDISTTFDRTDRKEIEADLVAEASRKARDSAVLMAKGFGASLGRVFAISQQGFAALGMKFGIADDSRYSVLRSARKEEILFVPSTITLQTKVTAIFGSSGESVGKKE